MMLVLNTLLTKLKAYDEAIHIAELLNNFELLCAAHAHKSLTMLPRLNLEQKHQLLRQLKSIEETYPLKHNHYVA